MKPTIIEFNLLELPALVQKELVTRVDRTAIISLQGPLGAGKTTTSQELIAQLGVLEPVVSPTFAYVNRYRLPSGRKLYHFDLYRVDTQEQFFRLGFEEYLQEPGALSLIEWPEVIFPLLKSLEEELKILYIKLEYFQSEGPDGEKRKIILSEKQ